MLIAGFNSRPLWAEWLLMAVRRRSLSGNHGCPRGGFRPKADIRSYGMDDRFTDLPAVQGWAYQS